MEDISGDLNTRGVLKSCDVMPELASSPQPACTTSQQASPVSTHLLVSLLTVFVFN